MVFNKDLKTQLDNLPLTAAVYYAITLGADQTANYIFNTKTADPHFSEFQTNLLALAYQGDALSIAKNLVLYGTTFSASDLTFSHPQQGNISKYVSHLGELSNIISATAAEQGYAIIKALAAGPMLATKPLCLNSTAILGSYTYIYPSTQKDKTFGIYRSFGSTSNNVITETLEATSLALLTHQNTKIILPHVEHAQREAVHKVVGGQQAIYMPLYAYNNFEEGQFIHEIGHYVQSFLFHNDAKPYSSTNRKAELDYTRIFQDILLQVVVKTHSPSLTSQLILDCQLDQTADNQKTMGCLTIKSYLPLYLYPSRQHDHGFIADCLKLFPPPEDIQIQENNFLGKKAYLEKYYFTLAANMKLDNSLLLVLDRLIEAYFYPDMNAEAEVIARLAELHTKDISPAAIELLSPLITYWNAHVSPVISQVKFSSGIPDCNDTKIDMFCIGEDGASLNECEQ